MHIGHNNMQGNNNMYNQQLPTTDQQRDQGIIITKDLKLQKQRKKSSKTEDRAPGFIARKIRCKHKELILPICKSLVRPHLEHTVLFWFSQLRRDIDKYKRYGEEQQR